MTRASPFWIFFRSLSFFNLFPWWRKRRRAWHIFWNRWHLAPPFPSRPSRPSGSLTSPQKIPFGNLSKSLDDSSLFYNLSSIGHHCSMLIILTKYRLTSIPTKGTTARYLAMRRSIFSRAGSTGLSLSGSQRVVLDNDPFPWGEIFRLVRIHTMIVVNIIVTRITAAKSHDATYCQVWGQSLPLPDTAGPGGCSCEI